MLLLLLELLHVLTNVCVCVAKELFSPFQGVCGIFLHHLINVCQMSDKTIVSHIVILVVKNI